MPVMRTYECPECAQMFDYLHMSSAELPPRHCPLCGAYTGSELEPEISAPRIAKTALSRAIDDVYTGLESSSVARSQMAAEELGIDAYETSAMKITDINTGLRQGDTSMPAVNNEVSRMMAANPGVGGLQPSEAAAQYAADTRKGAFAGAGEATRQGIVSKHRERAAMIARNGNLGTYTQ